MAIEVIWSVSQSSEDRHFQTTSQDLISRHNNILTVT